MDKFNSIEKPYIDKMQSTKKYLDSLVKPIGSLGKLEEYAIKVSGITGKLNNDFAKKAIVVFGADNGVWDEDITSVPQSVTPTQMKNMIGGVAGVAVLARHAGVDLKVVDIGVKEELDFDGIIDANLMRGTNNMAKGYAMSRDCAEKAIQFGFDMATNLKNEGYTLLGVGEMGICNTTTSAAVLGVFTDKKAKDVTGLGAGIDEARFNKKMEVIDKAIEINNPDKNDPIDVVAKVGGLDIAGMAGMFLGCASNRCAVVIDGFISAVAALLAYKINPLVKEYMFASHKSAERGYNIAINEIGLEPMFHLDMRLGEGSGCPFAFNVLQSGQNIISDMVTFSQGNVDDNDYVDIR